MDRCLQDCFYQLPEPGIFSAHRPQFTQFLEGFGIIPEPPAFLYGRLPGIDGVSVLPEASFLRICSAKLQSFSLSDASGRPAANCRAMECSAMAATAGDHLKASLFSNILQFNQCVFISPITIYTDEYRFRAISTDFCPFAVRQWQVSDRHKMVQQ